MIIDPTLDVYGPDVPLWERGQAGGRSRPLDRDNLFRNTKEVFEVFYELDIRCCLSHGTALGVYRDGDSIPWDDDADVALFSEDRPKLPAARAELRKRGFYVPDEGDPQKPVDPKSNMPWYDFVAIRDGEKVEGWIFDKGRDFYVYDPIRDGLTFPRKFFDKFSVILWRGEGFAAPNHVDQYLVKMYGPDWKTPDESKKYNPLRPADYQE